jgi:predicted transcriptional regulator
VFDLIVRGNMNKQIAATLGTTERTIKAHRHGVMEKMQVRSLAELTSSPSGQRSFRGTEKVAGLTLVKVTARPVTGRASKPRP